ncbi:alpha/beta fold hydrolase [Polycladospora coralii]|nr:alpha/beta hydrolase [Polycladospora coralii]
MQINGVQLHYQSVGTGKTILCIHPPLLTGENFYYQREQLANEFRIITLDLRGHGKSDASSLPLSYPLIVEDIVQLLDQLQINEVILCGYSTGGSIALEAMLRYPNLFVGGILISTMSEATRFYLKSRIHTAYTLSNPYTFKTLATAICLGNADSISTYQRLYQASRTGHIPNIKQYYQYSQLYQCTNRLHQITQPTLLLYGENDRHFHHYFRLLQNNIPKHIDALIMNAPHQLPTKATSKIHPIIRDWMKSL